MPAPPKRRFWRVARISFRWVRITAWVVLLTALLLAIWLNRVGLPEFLKARLVEELRQRGMEVEFTRMRLVWYRGIVADNLHFGQSGDPRGFRASATEGEVHLHWKRLLQRRLEVEGVQLRGGHLTLPVWGTNDTPRNLVIEKLGGELHFLPGDQWQVANLRAETFGVKLLLSGTVTNATAIQHWKFGPRDPKASPARAFWHDLVTKIEQSKFESPTEIIGSVTGDALDLQTFRVSLNVASPALDSPWGRGRHLRLSAQIHPQPDALVQAVIKLDAEQPQTRWGRAESIHLESQITPSLTQWTPTNAHLDLQVRKAETPWGQAAVLQLMADFRPNPSDPISSLADYALRGQRIQTLWARFAQAEMSASGVVSSSNAWPRSARTRLKFAGGEVASIRAASGSLEASLELPAYESLQFTNQDYSWWSRLDQIEGTVDAELADVHTSRLDLKSLRLRTNWEPPFLVVPELEAGVYDGTVKVSAQLETTRRQLSAELATDFDPHRATSLLASNVNHWLSEFTWKSPPRLQSSLNVTLPVWTEAEAWARTDWAGEVLPTLQVSGSFQTEEASFRKLTVTSARSDFQYTNRVWRLPNLQLTRPEGRARIAHRADEIKREFHFDIDSSIDLNIIRPLLAPAVQEVANDFRLTTPPSIRAELAGHWDRPESTTVRASLALTNVQFRGEPVLECRTQLTLTNQVLSLVAPEVVRSEGTGRAQSVVIDIPNLKLYINQATGSLHPGAITKVISRTVEDVMKPYRFLEAPVGSAHGWVDLADGMKSNLRFVASGGPFEWRNFKFERITGDVHWAGTTLMLSNIQGRMHGGHLSASALFDFTAREGADFAFQTRVQNINLSNLVADLGNKTNRLEGTLEGFLLITNANSSDEKSWFGSGDMTLRDGLIWEVPVFGLFSPLLNSIKPGSGNNRAKDAVATFLITNSVIYSSDLRIDASGMRLNYDGTVDFDTNIRGRMEAALFRNTPGVGNLVSKVFWPVTKMFEYKIAGTFSKPKAEPLYIPKVFLMPLHPLRSLRELFGDKEDAPALKPQE